ncbi:MAG TPA: hypothetical protein VFM50_10855 [Nocardioidaceae bacterium]|nr:hypothetical protein [Nocardioidaceae bacterium]
MRRARAEEPLAPFNLSLIEQHRYRPFEVVGANFVAVDVSDPEQGGAAEALTLSGASPEAPYAAVELELADPRAGVVRAGLATADGDHVVGVHDPVRGRVAIEVRRSGRTRLVRRKKLDLAGDDGAGRLRLGFVLCENQVTLLVDTGDGWQAVLSERDRVAAMVDLRRPERLTAHRYAWGGPGIARVRAGLFGMAGIRDPHLVQHADGRPYVREGKAYLTATCAGMGFFRQAHWGVFTLDLDDPRELEQVGQLFSLRDGLLLGDHAGQVVRDDDADRWIVATSSWGDFGFDGVHVRHLVTTDDVLHGVHVLDTQPLELPTRHSAWDPALTRIEGRWHVGFVESPSQRPFDFHPALAVGEPGGIWGAALTSVGAAADLHQCEGPILAEVQGRWWLLASDGDARNYPVFDLDMRRVGRLDAPYPTNIPHPQLVPLEDGEFLMITFDGTQYAKKVLGYGGHGDVLVLRSASIHDGSAR